MTNIKSTRIVYPPVSEDELQIIKCNYENLNNNQLSDLLNSKGYNWTKYRVTNILFKLGLKKGMHCVLYNKYEDLNNGNTVLHVINNNKLTHHKILIDTDKVKDINKYIWTTYTNCHGKVFICSNKDIHHNPIKHTVLTHILTGSKLTKTINNNDFDLRCINLLMVNKMNMAQVRKKPITNKSGVKGVHYDKQNKCWTAKITYNYTRIYLGLYNTIEEAKQAREIAETIYHEFGTSVKEFKEKFKKELSKYNDNIKN